MVKKGKEANKGNELLENPDALADRLSKGEEYLEKNKKQVFIIGGIIALIIVGALGYKYFKNQQDEKAQNDMFQAQFYFEADSLQKALLGDGNHFGFLDIIDEYPLSEGANLSHYYAGVIYMRQSEPDYQEAIDHLKKFKSDDLLVQGRAFALIGDAYMEQGNANEAAKFYKKAASYEPNEYISPQYWMKAAVAYESFGDLENAVNCYDAVVSKYPKSNEIHAARKHKARLKGKLDS
ncbi:MAG TPA: cytochrome C biosynthesis protein [Cytophagales bacterium]|jgi:tetratricopeptide (TPR) repeat protein|nr:cytochrome C biosynthesis protein [Cytophagales bacterium]